MLCFSFSRLRNVAFTLLPFFFLSATRGEDAELSTGEIDLLPPKYLQGPSYKVGAQENFSHGVDKLRKLVSGKPLTGSGIVVAVWDGGLVQATHQDLTGRVVFKDANALYLNNHATHVAGTIAGSGAGIAASEGVAPQATIWSFDFENDVSEMSSQPTGQIHVSNHSYAIS
ncbi:MAG: S8 family serine peptidase, partial [Rubripirellula sp.]